MIYIMTFNAAVGLEEFAVSGDDQAIPGKTVANWLADKLAVYGVIVEDLYEEDRGWELRLDLLHDGQQQGYYLGVTGIAGEENVEWQMMVTKQRSLLERLAGHNVLQDGDTLIDTLSILLRENNHQVADSRWQPE